MGKSQSKLSSEELVELQKNTYCKRQFPICWTGLGLGFGPFLLRVTYPTILLAAVNVGFNVCCNVACLDDLTCGWWMVEDGVWTQGRVVHGSYTDLCIVDKKELQQWVGPSPVVVFDTS